MDNATLTAAAVVTVIAALGGVAVQIINARSAAADRREAAAVAAAERSVAAEERKLAAEERRALLGKSDVIIDGNTKIHTLTNSTNSNLQKTLEVQAEEVKGLRREMAQMKLEKQETAAAKTIADLQIVAAAKPGMDALPGTEKSLANIDKNTKAIDANTKRTEDKIDDIAGKASDPAVTANVERAVTDTKFVDGGPP